MQDSDPRPAEDTGLRLELGSQNDDYACACCRQPSQMVYGLVYHHGDAHAVYLAGWSAGHREEGVRLVVSIGDWSDGAPPDDRIAVALSCRLEGPHVRFYIVSPERSPYAAFAYLGELLPEPAALTHPHLDAFMDVARQVVRDDPRVRAYLKAVARS